MTDTVTTTAVSGANALVEKVPLETYVPPAKPSLIGLSHAEISDRLAEIGVQASQRKMRTQQLWNWMYFRGAKSFAEMTNVSKDMRAELEKHFTVDRPEVVAEQISNDGTRKWLLRLPSGDKVERAHEVECVYIPETDRGTLCVSSQVGCTLNCSFCHTGTQRLVRNLTAGEIVGQVMVARDRLNDWADREDGTRRVTNIVMMGMGEPLYNFDAVRDALLIVGDNEGTANWFPHHCDCKMARRFPLRRLGWITGKRFFGKAVRPGRASAKSRTRVVAPWCLLSVISLWRAPRAGSPIARRSIAAGPRHLNCADASRRPAPPSHH